MDPYESIMKKLNGWVIPDRLYEMHQYNERRVRMITPGRDSNYYLILGIAYMSGRWYVFDSTFWTTSIAVAYFDTEEATVAYISMMYNE